MEKFILFLVLYIGHIFLCRYINIWADKNVKEVIYISLVPVAWFIPVVGLIIVGIQGISVLFEKWQQTNSYKWFVGEEIN